MSDDRIEVDPTVEDDENAHTREVYARYGLAMYYGQVMEEGITNLIVVFNLEAKRKQRQNITVAEIDVLFDSNYKKTLGRLMFGLRGLVTIPPDLDRKLEQALKTRNWLAHHFFKERAVGFVTLEGRKAMILETIEAAESFREADRGISKILAPIREQVGITVEMLNRELAVMLAEAKAGKGES
jgi:hypothetical protein